MFDLAPIINMVIVYLSWLLQTCHLLNCLLRFLENMSLIFGILKILICFLVLINAIVASYRR